MMNEPAFQIVRVGFRVYLPERYGETGLSPLFNNWYKNISNIDGFDGLFGPDMACSCIVQFKVYNFNQIHIVSEKLKETISEYLQKYNLAIGALE